MTPLFIDSIDHSLFGMYHHARGTGSMANRAVVLCAPIGQEYVRTYWCLRLLAGQLARRGIHVLRFDYAGVGDSAGALDEIQSLQVWQDNIKSAIEVLKQRSAAQSVMLLGLRAGAMLASKAALDSRDVNSMLLWEPIHNGENYLNELRGLHAEMLDMWICKMQTEKSDVAEEILGSRFAKPLIDELSETQISWDQHRQPVFVMDTNNREATYKSLPVNSLRKVEFTNDEPSWVDLRQLETAWLRPQTTRRMVDQVMDTFDRLQRVGILEPVAEVV